MYIVGITGGSGAGKASAAKVLLTFGAETLDCDSIYHDLLSNNAEMTAEIEAHFNNISTDGKIDRHKLGELVLNNPESLQKLNSITHKYVNDEIEKSIAAYRSKGVKIAVIDAIALIESGQGKKCDLIIGILAPYKKRVSRIKKRDNLTQEYAQMRINAQQPESFYRDNCDYILENIYDTQAKFEEKCIEFFRYILKENFYEQ